MNREEFESLIDSMVNLHHYQRQDIMTAVDQYTQHLRERDKERMKEIWDKYYELSRHGERLLLGRGGKEESFEQWYNQNPKP